MISGQSIGNYLADKFIKFTLTVVFLTIVITVFLTVLFVLSII
jgi:hypothetical protein